MEKEWLGSGKRVEEQRLIKIIMRCGRQLNNYIIQRKPMQQSSHMHEFNLRSTMPSSFNRLSIKKVLEAQEKVQKSWVDSIMNSTTNCESNSNSFFVRISKGSLEEQKRIYKWRMTCGEHFVPISSLKLQSEGNCYNPNLLYKVELAIWKSNFVQVKDLCLTKCVNLMKSVLQGILVLFEYFEPVIFNEKMIYQMEDGATKIWMDERFYINPNNELYCKNSKEVSVEESLRSVIEIFQLKCLKTKLSTKLFMGLARVNTVKAAVQVIQAFQLNQNLFPIQGLKVSVSTGTALNTSSSLQFSGCRSAKKRKTTIKSDKELKVKNMASHKFLQAKSMELSPNSLSPKKEREQRNTYQSQYEGNEEQSICKSNGFLEANPQKPASSLVISEMFHSDSELNKEGKKSQHRVEQNSIRINSNIMKSSPKILQSNIFDNDPKSQIVNRPQHSPRRKQDSNGQQHEAINTIISKNGWNPSITSLFDRKNVKESLCEGKEENLQLKNFKLKKLHTMGKNVRESILPVDEEADDY